MARRRGRKRKSGGERHKSGKLKQSENRERRLGPTPEAIMRRADLVGLEGALEPDAATYIGVLFRRGVLTEDEKRAGYTFMNITERYQQILEIPKRPVAVNLNKSPAGPPPEFDPIYVRRIRRNFELCDNAVRSAGVLVYSATLGAVRNEPQNSEQLVKKGLARLALALSMYGFE
jgi:hypothetical protein